MIIHIVQQGETVYSIARKYSASPTQIIRDNGLGPSGYPALGQALIIALPKVTHTVEPGESLFLIAIKYKTSVNNVSLENIDTNFEKTTEVFIEVEIDEIRYKKPIDFYSQNGLDENLAIWYSNIA